MDTKINSKDHFIKAVSALATKFTDMNFEVRGGQLRLCGMNITNTMMLELIRQDVGDGAYTFGLSMSDFQELLTEHKSEFLLQCNGAEMLTQEGKKILKYRLNNCDEVPTISPVPTTTSIVVEASEWQDFMNTFKKFEHVELVFKDGSISCTATEKAKAIQNSIGGSDFQGPDCSAIYKVEQLEPITKAFTGKLRIDVGQDFPIIFTAESVKVLVAPASGD